MTVQTQIAPAQKDFVSLTERVVIITGAVRGRAPQCGAVAVIAERNFERKTVSPEQKLRIVAQQCIPRPETPEDLVGTALFLSFDNAAFLTGQCLTVDGGAAHR